MFSSDTFTPGRANNTNHTPMAYRRDKHQHGQRHPPHPLGRNPWKPSVEYDTTSRVAPPTISCEEENTEGVQTIGAGTRDQHVGKKPKSCCCPTRNRIPIRGVHPRKSVADTFPEAMITSPANPSRMAASCARRGGRRGASHGRTPPRTRAANRLPGPPRPPRPASAPCRRTCRATRYGTPR